MLFNTVTYAYFFSVVFVVSWALHGLPRARLTFLLAASYVFYAGWTFVGWERLLAAHGPERWALVLESLKFVPILFVGTSLDWLLGVWLDRIDEPRRRRWMLIATLVVNVGILVFFKYWNWGVDTLLWVFRDRLGLAVPDVHLRVELPIGISFFCFMSLSYVVDVYRRTIPACRSYLQYLTYISFFPHLVAGPIVRGRDLLPHLERPTRLSAATGGEGLFLIATGLVKKVVIGDYLAVNFVDRVFGEPTSFSSVESLGAMYGYAIQVYCDFSGYSDVAIGSALLLGYRFKINFDQPYKASNVAEFWRRWHISLSTWVRDYLFFPLGGSRGSEGRVAFNLMVTMVIIGLWHGASTLWLIYGLSQGAALVAERWFERLRGGRPYATTLGRKVLCWTLAFHFTTVTCSLIRAPDMEALRRLFSDFGASSEMAVWGWIALAGAAITHYMPDRWIEACRLRVVALPTAVIGLLLGLLAGTLFVVIEGQTPFIYFQF